MSNDYLRMYTVKVGEGSGCLFQPMTDKYTYILTAKHLFEKKEDDGRGNKINIPIPDGTDIPINKQNPNGNSWAKEPIPFTLKEGETYFPHKEVDLAILKIEPQYGFDSIHIQGSYYGDLDIKLCGFPASRTEINDEKYTFHSVKEFQGSGDFCELAQLSETLSQENIEGMSGGGLLKIGENGISIIGVQSKMASSNLPMGQIGFVPMRYAKEIVDYTEYKGNLEKFLPIYFKSFEFLKDDIFKLQAGLPTVNKANKMSKILNAKAIEIQKSSITPIFIRNYLKENLPSVYKYGAKEIQNKKLWSLWLELLTILNIAKKYSHCSDEIPEILKKVRLIYSNVNSDFWIENLHKLHKVDFRGLEINGTVVVASNIPAVNNFHVLRLENIPGSIAMVQDWRDDFDLEKISQRIDSSTDFPLEKYKFVNISAFKEGILENDNVDFENKEMLNCIEILEKLYEQLFTR